MHVSELELVRLRRECVSGNMTMPLQYYQEIFQIVLERELSKVETLDAIDRLNKWASPPANRRPAAQGEGLY